MEQWQLALILLAVNSLVFLLVWRRLAELHRPRTRTGTPYQPWFAVYEVDSGHLLSVGTSISDPLPAGVDCIALTDQYPAYLWDAEGRRMIEPEDYEGPLWGLPPMLKERARAAGKVVWTREAGLGLGPGPLRPSQ